MRKNYTYGINALSVRESSWPSSGQARDWARPSMHFSRRKFKRTHVDARAKPTAFRLSTDAGAGTRRISCACAWPRRPGLHPPSHRNSRHGQALSRPSKSTESQAFRRIRKCPRPIPGSSPGMGMTGGACSSGPRPNPDSRASSPRMKVFCNALNSRNSFGVRL